MNQPDEASKVGDEPRPESARETLWSQDASGPPAPDELAESFPQLDVLELLGQGGMGFVYKARQKGLDRMVALKLLPHAVAEDKSFAERFAREARALARLSHPSIVAVHDSGQIGELYYFIMEYVDGLNLRELLSRSDGRVQPDQAVHIIGSVCDALEYAHDEGVIHRDIKPENILLDKRAKVKIADFGLAKLLGANGGRQSRLTMISPHKVLGTPHYMAPEQTERPMDVDHRADIYSLGVVFYEMLTGELPLGRFPLPSEMGRGDAALDQIVVRALDKNPDRRFQRASEIKIAVDSALSGVGPVPFPAITPGAASPLERPSEAPTGQQPHVDLFRAYQRVRGPANLLLVAGIIALISLNPLGLVTIVGAVKMKRMEMRSLALAGAVLSIIPASVCFPLGIIAGIWGVYVLTRPHVVDAFELMALANSGESAASIPP